MLTLTINNKALDFHHKLVKCWLSKKIKGNKSKKNKSGYKCEDIECEICKKNIHKANLPMEFIDFLTPEKIDALILSKPAILIEINEEYENLNIDKSIVKKLFISSGYENWFQPNFGNKILNIINQDTCTYCNRNYTLQTIYNKSRAELDHWFAKETFPLLALSFYNLIPSCHTCNHLKLNNVIDNNFAHPYTIKEENQKFKFSFKYINMNEQFEVKLNVEENSKMDNSLKDFKIKEIYNAHSEKELKDLLELRYKYSDNYIDILINKTFTNLMSKEEIYRTVFGVEIKEEDYHKRPFSKFKHDIIEELLKH
jgi:hypothetical protein